MTRDPIKDGRNWHAYGGGINNPITGADPEGLKFGDSVRAYIANMWKTLKDPRKIIDEINDLLGGFNRAQAKRAQEAIKFFEKMEKDLERAQKVWEHIVKTGKPPQGLKGRTKFNNLDGKLPKGGQYKEYDIFPRSPNIGATSYG